MSKQDHIKAASKREQKKARFHSAEHDQARGKAIKSKGTVSENLSRDNFRVTLDNGIAILASLSGRIRQHHIRVMVGDRVEVELSPYDLTRGRISFRYNK
jgi:translation initiation factor IF-1